MPTQDNCDDLKVESCVDENGQTINGGDSYEVPTGRYVKHVVNVCGSGGAAAGSGLETKACPDGGLTETWGSATEVCLSIATEPDSALVLDGGVLKIDSTKLKVTSDNVLPAGTDPGLVSTLPVFTDPNGNVWNNQSDYNIWLYEEQERQDDEIERVEEESKKRDLLIEAEIIAIIQRQGIQKITFVNSANPGANPYPGYKVKDSTTITFNQTPFDPLPHAGDELRLELTENSYRHDGIVSVSKPYQGNGSYQLIDVTLKNSVFGLETAQVGDEATFELHSAGNYVTPLELEEDQKRQEEEFKDALYKDVDDCGTYTVVDTDKVTAGEIHFQNFSGRTRITGPDPRFGNGAQTTAKVTYEDGTEHILTYAGISGSTGGGCPCDGDWNEVFTYPPLGSTVQFCLEDVFHPTIYVPYDDFEKDQKRQDDATRTAVAVLEAEILALAVKTQEDQDRQDDEWKADQERQDEQIAALANASPCSTATGISDTIASSTEISIRNIDVHDKTEVILPYVRGAKVHKDPEFITINGDEYPILDTLVYDSLQAVEYIIAGHHGNKYFGKEVSVTVCDYDPHVLKSGDTMTGDLNVEADVHAKRVETLSVDSGEGSNLNLKYDGATKVYIGRNEVTIQPPLQLNTEGVDVNHAVTKGYIDALDAKQAAEISTIEYKLDALVGLTFQGTYEFKHDQTCEEEYQECMTNAGSSADEQTCMRNLGLCEGNNVDPGFFEAIDPDGRFDHLQEIIISKNDKSNVEIDWAGVLDAGDYLEVDHVLAGQLDKTNYGLYRITEEPVERTNSKGEKVYDLTLQFLQGDGVLNQNELYEIRGITAAEGVNPEELADFLTKEEAANTYSPKTHTHSTYADKTHTHSGSDITSGTVAFARLPTGTTSTTVSKGDHTHSYASSTHAHGNKYVKTGESDDKAHEVRIYKSGSLFYIK